MTDTSSSTAEVLASSAGSSDTAAADSAATRTDAQAEEKNTEVAESTEDSGQNTGRISVTAVAIKDSRNKIAKNKEGKDVLLLVAGDAEQDQLIAEITPADAADHTVTWKSEDESVVKVDADGKLTAGREGTAKITVTTTDGGHSASLLVTVQAAKENSSAADGGKQGSASGKAEETQKTADDAGNDTEDSDNVQKQDDSASVISVSSTEGAETLIQIKGRLDTNSSPQFEKAMAPILQGPTKQVRVDCSQLAYISSSGLRMFLMLQKNISQKKGSLRLCGLNDSIKEVFAITGFAAIFTIE